MTPVSPAQWKGRARWQRQKEPDSRVWKSQWEALAHEVIISGDLALKDRKGIGPGRKEDGWFSTQDGRNKRVKCRWGRGGGEGKPALADRQQEFFWVDLRGWDPEARWDD